MLSVALSCGDTSAGIMSYQTGLSRAVRLGTADGKGLALICLGSNQSDQKYVLDLSKCRLMTPTRRYGPSKTWTACP